LGIRNDAISSIKVVNVHVEVFTENNFEKNSCSFSRSIDQFDACVIDNVSNIVIFSLSENL